MYSERFTTPPIDEFWYATFYLVFTLPDGRRHATSLKLDAAELDFGPRPSESNYKARYGIDWAVPFIQDREAWYRKVSLVADAISKRVANSVITTLTQDKP